MQANYSYTETRNKSLKVKKQMNRKVESQRGRKPGRPGEHTQVHACTHPIHMCTHAHTQIKEEKLHTWASAEWEVIIIRKSCYILEVTEHCGSIF